MQATNKTTESTHKAEVSVLMWLARVISIVSGIFFLLPIGFYRVFGSGRDPNWEIALHHAFENNWIFGKEIVFTYGPLGFLYSRLSYPGVAGYIAAFDILSYFSIFVVLCICISALKTIPELIAAVFLCACVGIYRQPLDPSILYLFFTLFSTALFVQHKTSITGSAAWVFATLCFYLKVSCGIVAMLCVIVASLFVVLSSPKAKASIIATIIGLVFFTTFTLLLPLELGPYLLYSLEFMSGYADAMYKVDPNNRYYLSMAIVTLLFFALGTLCNSRSFISNPNSALVSILAAGFLFILFKQGFVRADSHIRDYIQYAPISLAIFYPFLDTAQRSRMKVFAFAVLVSAFAVQENRFSYEYFPKKLDLIENYVQTFADEAPQGHIPNGLAPVAPLSPELLERIGEDSVDVVTFQNYQLLRSKLNYRPRPVFHSYAAFTKKLDELNANFYESALAPKFILYSHIRIDDRYPFFDESLTRQAIRRWYQPVLKSSGFFLLERQAQAKTFNLSQIDGGFISLDEWFQIPESDSPLYLQASIKLSPLGKLIAILYRPPPCYIELTLADARVLRVRAIRKQLETGVLINKAVLSLNDAARFFNAKDNELVPIKSIKLDSSWKWGVVQEVSYSIKKAG